MSSKYKFHNADGCYFVTCTVVGWVDVFTRNVYRDILIESCRYCQQTKGLLIHAYVIMTNHVHLIVSRNSKNLLEDIMRDMKKFTSVKILEPIKTEQERRKMSNKLKTIRTSELMSVVFVLTLITLFNCGPRDKSGVTIQSPDKTDETFKTFFNEFGVDSTFQAQRIKYPLPYLSYPDDSDELTTREISLGQWKYRNLVDDSLSIEFEPVIEMKDSLNVVCSQRGIDNGILIMYDFVKEGGKWYLVKMTNASD